MSRNLVQDGKKVLLPVGGALTGGTYVQVGKLNAVLESDADSSNNAVCFLDDVHNLSVVALGAMAVGDYVYTTDGSTIDDVNTGDIVGSILDTISGAGTVTVRVRLHN
jgi:predicted RecA/RadA family phage recombinase